MRRQSRRIVLVSFPALHRFISMVLIICVIDTYLVCKLTSRLPASIPKDIFPKRTSPYGFEYYDINYNLIMTVESATLTFEFEFEGKTYGSVTAKYY